MFKIPPSTRFPFSKDLTGGLKIDFDVPEIQQPKEEFLYRKIHPNALLLWSHWNHIRRTKEKNLEDKKWSPNQKEPSQPFSSQIRKCDFSWLLKDSDAILDDYIIIIPKNKYLKELNGNKEKNGQGI
jgi:hypothetical protein